MKLIIDIEANNLLFDVSKIWCIVAYDLDTDTTYTFEPDEIDKALALLSKAEVLIGHNIVGYDLPAIKKLNPEFTYKGEVIDTLILSRLRYPQLGSHSLKAWGERLKFPKDEHSEFSYYSPEMLTYCVQDVKVSTKLYKILADKIDPNQPFVKLEQNVLAVQTKAEMYGVGFKYDDAVKLIQQIDAEMAQIAEDIAPILGINTVEYVTKLKKDGTPNVHASRKISLGYDYKIEDGKCIVYITSPITLDDKKLLTERLLSLGWKPTMYTDKGTPRIADKGEACPNLSTIEGVPDTVGKYFVLKHRRSLIDGMLRHVRTDGRIPSEANTLGAITGRYTHRKIANLPAVRSLYGKEIRGLFYAGEGRVQVGSDLAGIEARMLAHFMGDDDYTEQVVNGDIHTTNQLAAGLPTRDAAKTFFYGFLYGAGDAKVGTLVNGNAYDGKKVKEKFLNSLPSLKLLIEDKQKEARKGYITSLDGRPIYITKTDGEFDTRKALNSLLQSSATIYFKKWVEYIDKAIVYYNIDATIMILYHDEVQISVAEGHVNVLKSVLQKALEATDKFFKVKCPNAIDIKQGSTWEDCH